MTVHTQVRYRDVMVQGTRVAYREAGDPSAPAVLLLHGVPSSSRMYDDLIRQLGDRFHCVAPDYPGFGNSDAPSPEAFPYTFEHLAEVVAAFTEAIQIGRYTLFMQDYGAPIGMRLARLRPSSVDALIFQNGNVYADGLGPMWEQRKAYWRDRATHEAAIRAAHLSRAVTRGRHIGSDPDAEAYDPDLWEDELGYLNRPGVAEIQLELIYDYRTNIESYPEWQAWMREQNKPTLVLWGRRDPAFTEQGAHAFRRDVSQAEVHVIDAGHFAMDTRLDEVASLTREFLHRVTLPVKR